MPLPMKTSTLFFWQQCSREWLFCDERPTLHQRRSIGLQPQPGMCPRSHWTGLRLILIVPMTARAHFNLFLEGHQVVVGIWALFLSFHPSYSILMWGLDHQSLSIGIKTFLVVNDKLMVGVVNGQLVWSIYLMSIDSTNHWATPLFDHSQPGTFWSLLMTHCLPLTFVLK